LPEAHEFPGNRLEKDANVGELQFTLSDGQKVRPISDPGKVDEIACQSGGAGQLCIGGQPTRTAAAGGVK
jgi:hypothetical protein